MKPPYKNLRWLDLEQVCLQDIIPLSGRISEGGRTFLQGTMNTEFFIS